jgi:hypothetical protein
MIVTKYIQDRLAEFGKKINEHFRSFKNSNYSSKFLQRVLENCHLFGKMEDIMKVVCYNQKGRHLGTVEKLYMYKETLQGSPLNDEHTFTYNKIFDVMLKREGHLANVFAL